MTESDKKGWRRKGCVIPAASIALLLAIFFGRAVYLALTATSGQSVNYFAKAAELVEKYQPTPRAGDETSSNENGWDSMLAAIEEYDAAAARDTSGIPWRDAFEFALEPLSYDPERTEFSLDQHISAAEGALVALGKTDVYDHLDRLAVAGRYVRPLSSGGRLVSLLLPEMRGVQSIALAVTLQLRRANDQRDDAAEVRAVVHGLALAKVLSHQHTLIDRLVGMRIIDLVLRELRAALTDRPLPQQELDQIADALDRSRFPSLRLAIEGQRLHILDIIQWAHTDNGRGDGRLIVSRLDINTFMGGPPTNSVVSSVIDKLSSIRYPSKKQTTRTANDLFDGFLEYIDLTRGQRMSWPSSPDLDTMALPSRQVLLRRLVPSFGRIIDMNDQYHSVVAGTRIMVAVEQFNAHNGRFPRSLDELIPDLLATLPGDPFAKDGRFIYRTLDPALDAFGRSYTLYSVGYDGTDDGGVMDTEDDISAFRYGASGIDYVFNLPRPMP